MTTLLQQGMLTNILTCSVLGNLLWLGVNLALRGDSVFKNLLAADLRSLSLLFNAAFFLFR
ncbi:hypothetical protein ACLBQY_32160, partial [Klebsiella pneumoniae]